MEENHSSNFFPALLLVLASIGAGAYFYWNIAGKDATYVPPTPTEEQTKAPAQAMTTPEQKAPTTTAPITSKVEKNMITLQTNHGVITFETYNNDAPNTVNNFITLAKKGFYDGLTFHRVIGGFMIQGGDPKGDGTGGPGYSFADELNASTQSYKDGYKKGVVAMANAGPNTNGSQFFIMLADTPLPHAYTIFGKVTSGQDIVDKIGQVGTDSNDKPLSPVLIQKVTIK